MLKWFTLSLYIAYMLFLMFLFVDFASVNTDPDDLGMMFFAVLVAMMLGSCIFGIVGVNMVHRNEKRKLEKQNGIHPHRSSRRHKNRKEAHPAC